MKVVEINHSHRRMGGPLRPSKAPVSGQGTPVTTLASMWQRIPGDVAVKIRQSTPQNFAVLELPNPQVLRSVGVSAKTVGCRDHPYAKWTTKQFSKATTGAEALTQIEMINNTNKAAIKFKLNFTNSLQVVFSRRDNTDASTLICTSCYEPSAAFSSRTGHRAAIERANLAKKLEFVADDKGHITRPSSAARSRPVSPFNGEKLYQECPKPEPSPLTFNFTPMSSISYLQRPNTVISGVRPGLNKTNPNAIHFRPRSYNMDSRPHSGSGNRYAMDVVEKAVAGRQSPIDGRNALSPPRGLRPGTAGSTGSSFQRSRSAF